MVVIWKNISHFNRLTIKKYLTYLLSNLTQKYKSFIFKLSSSPLFADIYPSQISQKKKKKISHLALKMIPLKEFELWRWEESVHKQ